MKKVFSGIALLTLALTACNQPQPTATPYMQLRAPQQPLMVQQFAASRDDNPAFIRKMQNPAAYHFEFDASTRSICGTNDMQQVNDYDGTLGQPVSFVKAHQGPVGALAMGSPDASRKFCSGTLISEDLFLTANHCVDSNITKDWAVFNYEKAAGSPNLLPQDHYKVAEIVEEGNGLDYSIIRIEGKPGLKYGFTRIRAELPEDGHLLTIIQHPQGEPKQIESGPKAGESGNYLSYVDLDTQPGSSGSGVLDKDGYLVGVHTNGGCYSSGGANKGVKMTEIAKASPTIQNLLKAQAAQAAPSAQFTARSFR